MSDELIQWVLEIIFSKFMLYIAPLIFLFMVALFSERIVDMLHRALTLRSR
jgi:positive regulator of sigma E activity